jgi:acyl-CoA reductase-like NAD-dependent aldehyde dehydrogenase
MTTDDIPFPSIAQRADTALKSAHKAFLNSGTLDMPAADRAEHARRAHELAAYARELLGIARATT